MTEVRVTLIPLPVPEGQEPPILPFIRALARRQARIDFAEEMKPLKDNNLSELAAAAPFED